MASRRAGRPPDPHLSLRALPLRQRAGDVKSSKGPRRQAAELSLPAVVENGRELAAAVGLVYVDDTAPGIRRRRIGKGFVYVDADSRRFSDEATLQRIRKLAIPPAYT